MKHTPGPWEILPEEVGRSYVRIRRTVLGGRYKIANVLSVNYEGNGEFINKEVDEVRANARLIAAAPDMLEALIECREIIKYLKQYVEGQALSAEGDCDSQIKVIDSVIERATGQSISDIIATGEGK